MTSVRSYYRGAVRVFDETSKESFRAAMKDPKPLWAILLDDDGNIIERYKRDK